MEPRLDRPALQWAIVLHREEPPAPAAAPHPHARLVGCGLLDAWICAEPDATEDEVVAAARDAGPPEDLPDELIRDRLFGGYRCERDPEARHIFFALGCYTYVGGNIPMPPDRIPEIRAEIGAEYIGGGLFTKEEV